MKSSLDLKVAIAIIVFCLFNYLYLIPAEVIAEGSSPVYPYLINSMLMLFSLGYLLESFAAMRAEKKTAAGEAHIMDTAGRGEACGRDEPGEGNGRKAIRVATLFGLMAAWYWTLESLGFMLSAFIFLVLSSIVYGAKSPLKIGLLSIAMPLFFHALFRTLGTALPEGPVEELITSFIYG